MASLTSGFHRADHWALASSMGSKPRGSRHGGDATPTGSVWIRWPARRRPMPTLDDDLGHPIRTRAASAQVDLAGPVDHRGPGRHRAGCAGGSDRLVHPPVRSRRGSGTGNEEPGPWGDRPTPARPGRRQPGGEPPHRRRTPESCRDPGMGHGRRIGRPGPRLAAPTAGRRARGRRTGLAGHRRGRVAPSGRLLPARVVVPIWRDPWMVVGARTFCGDLVPAWASPASRDEGDDRYPKVDLGALVDAGRIWCSCRTSPTRSARMTGLRPSRGSPRRWCPAGTSPGTDRRWPRPGPRCRRR